MKTTTKRKLLFCSYIASSLLLASCSQQTNIIPARPALTPPPATAPELDAYLNSIMANYDINHDNRLSEDEFARAAMAMFDSIDKNKDDMLDREEMGARWNGSCALADTNGDQHLSLMEVMRDQNARFKKNDLNNDGFLDHEELHTLLIQKFQNHQ